MSPTVHIAALGAVDSQGIAGSALQATDFGPDGLASVRWKTLFALPNPAYRHLDLFGRCVCLATEAAGISSIIPVEDRRDTALVLATRMGCLQSDMDFAQSLQPGERISPAVFPYTLPSTCLGELAIRHRLQGPLLCLMSSHDGPEASREAAALFEARRLIENGEARAAVVCLGDCLSAEHAREHDLPARVGVASVILTRAENAQAPIEWDELCASSDPVELVLTTLRKNGEAQ